MIAVLGQNVGEEICDALGLDSDMVKSIDIHIAADAIVTATIESYLNRDDIQELVLVLKKYELVEKVG
jgi:hypothetical protein